MNRRVWPIALGLLLLLGVGAAILLVDASVPVPDSTPAAPEPTPTVPPETAARHEPADPTPGAGRSPAAAGRQLVWKITGNKVPAPPDGTRIGIRVPGSEMPLKAVVSGGRIVLAGVPTGTRMLVAELPDGALALLLIHAGGRPGGSAVFSRPGEIEIRLVDEDDAPLAGMRLGYAFPGVPGLRGKLVTDAGGHATLTGVLTPLVELWTLGENDRAAVRIANLSANTTERPIVLKIMRVREVVLRLWIDGSPYLPEKLDLRLAGPDGVERDAAAGVFRFRYVPREADRHVGLRFRLPGFERVERSIPPAPADRVQVVDVELQRVFDGAVEARVEGEIEAGWPVHLDRYDEPSRIWRVHDRKSPTKRRLRFGGLQPGTYRLRDSRGTTISPTFEPGARDVVLDLRAIDWIEGTVELPEGVRATDVRVVAEGERSGWASPRIGGPGMPVGDDRTFALLAPRDSDIRLRLWHPAYGMSTTSSVTVRAPRTDVLLSLEGGGSLTFQLQPADTHPRRVLLLPAAEEGAPPLERAAVKVGQEHRVSGLPAGRYTLWIGDERHAPLSVAGVVVMGGETDLGPLRLESGVSLRVLVLVAEGASRPRLEVKAVAAQQPVYERKAYGQAGDDVTLRGLTAGRFRIRVGGFPFSLLRTVDLDESPEQSLTIDLR